VTDLFDDAFHGAALRAYLECSAETGQWPPDSELTRQRAYRIYEEGLKEKNGSGEPAVAVGSPPGSVTA
jgi:hypothetical protein